MHEEFKLYFENLEKLCGNLIKPFLTEKVKPFEAVNTVVQNRKLRTDYENIYPKIQNLVKSFWIKNSKRVNEKIKTLPGLKGFLGGDLGPHFSDGSIPGGGVYFDTILIEDPLKKILDLPANWLNKDGLTLKYLIELFLQKDFFLTEVEPPIALLIDGSACEISSEIRGSHLSVGAIEAMAFLNNALGTNFSEMWEFRDFFRIFLKKPKDFQKHVKTPEAFYFSEIGNNNIESQIEEHIRLTRESIDFRPTPFSDANDTETVIIQIFSYFSSFLTLSHQAKTLGAELLIPSSPALHWYLENLRLLEKEVNLMLRENFSFSFSATNHLLSEKNNWLANISANDLNSLRLMDSLPQLRNEIFSCLSNLSANSFSDYSKKCNEIDVRLSRIFTKHQEKLKELNSNTKDQIIFASTDLVAPTIAFFKPSILGAFENLGPLLGTLAGSIKLKDLVKIVVQHTREKKKLANSPVGILWQKKSSN